MIKYPFASFLLFLSLVTAVSASTLDNTQLVDRIVAVVNDDVITLSEIEKEGKDFLKEIVMHSSSQDINDQLNLARHKILSSLIDKMLVEQRAQDFHLTVAEQELDMAVDQIAADNNLSTAAMLQQLTKEGLSVADYRQKLRWQILQSKLINYEIRSKVVITEEKARKWYKQNYSNGSNVAEGYHLQQIGIVWDSENGDRAEDGARKMAEELRQRAINGENFSTLAHNFSQLPSASKGGDVGFFAENELAPYMRKSILSMKPGDISPLINTNDNSFQFFKLLSVKSGEIIEQAPFDTVRDDIIKKLKEQELNEQFSKWVKGLRDNAYIKENL